jgi:hypothetical protein
MIIPFIQKKNFLLFPSFNFTRRPKAEDDETDDDGFAALDDAKAIRVVFLSLVFVGERDVLRQFLNPTP